MTTENENMEVKRFDLITDGWGQADMEEFNDGDYVLFSDIKHLLSRQPSPHLELLRECESVVKETRQYFDGPSFNSECQNMTAIKIRHIHAKLTAALSTEEDK